METEVKDLQDVHETPEEEVEETTEETEEELTAEQIAELKRNAEVSSQNYERAKKAEEKAKKLEEEKKLLEEQLALDDIDVDDDKVSAKLSELDKKLSKIEEEKSWNSVLTDYPAIKDKRQEFDEYLEEYPGFPVEKVAKLFVTEKGYNETSQQRKGLETGGVTKTAPKSGKMSHEDVKRLRETNYKEYRKLLLAGKIKL